MSEALIVRRGGTGGFSINTAVIHVNAEAGSTIVFSKGGVTVKTLAPGKAHPNSDGISADYYFSVSPSNYGTWTITATKDIYTSVKTVEVNAAKQYDLKVIYQLMLYNSGNTYDYPWRYVRQGANVVLPTGETLKCGPYSGNGNIYPGGGFVIDQTIDLSNYSTLYAHFVLNTIAYTSKVCVFASSTYTGANQIYKLLVENNTSGVLASTIVANTDPSLLDDGIISCSVSNLQGGAYINVGGRCPDTRSNMVFEVDRVWLEI